MSKSRIAVIISLLLAAPAGMVALAQSATESEATEPTQTEEIQATAAEPTAQPVEAVAVTETTVVEQTTVVAAPAEPRRMFQVVQSNTFPQGSTDSEWHYHLPRQAAYLARMEQQRGPMIALGSSFPAGSNGDEAGAYQHLPVQVAYFNRMEQTRLASAAAPQPMARSEVQPAGPVARSTDDSTQAGSADVAMIR